MAEITTLEVWERQPDEPPRAFAAFTKYRDLGPTRSLAKAAGWHYHGSAKTVPKPYQVSGFKEWSRKYRWVARAAAWDQEEDRRLQLERREQAKEARDRAIRGAQLVQRIAVKGLAQIDGRIGNAEENPPPSLLRYWREATEMEFVALGLPIHVQRTALEEEVEAEEMDPNRALLNKAQNILDSYKGPTGPRR